MLPMAPSNTDMWDGARDTSMAAEYLLIDDGGDGQAVEAVGESLPQFDIKAPLTWETVVQR